MSDDFRRAPGAGFTCVHCARFVPAKAWGTKHRNHCPHCLWSRHVDDVIGDRRNACAGPMAPVALEVRAGAEWAIIHRCQTCAALRANRVAGDDHELALVALALRPLAHPAFPLDRIEPR
ncbi:MAG: RNHCP domain-containing protein [Phycisphaerales bacterium]